MQPIHTQIQKLPYLLTPRGWVAFDEQETKVLAHAKTFAQLNKKIANQPEKVVIFPLGNARLYLNKRQNLSLSK